ncbi:hypothetical protein ASZ78_003181 [Callipepla squamata]|uniref:Uncharacterized protein n=1 Tax=Callipepla squamata TaxID=9009 RepID=A0A226MJJ7_CALSU|nr:hypothetical protein ASZ78_003181 [Callipepla squamata]
MMGGLLLEVWAVLFRLRQEILGPVLPWLHQEALTQLLWPALGDRAETFIQGLVVTIVSWWDEEACKQLGLKGVHLSGEKEQGRRTALWPRLALKPPHKGHTSRPNSNTKSANRKEQPSTPEAVLHGDPSPSAPGHSPVGAQQPHKRRAGSDLDWSQLCIS